MCWSPRASETGFPASAGARRSAAAMPRSSAAALYDLLQRTEATVIDLSLSRRLPGGAHPRRMVRDPRAARRRRSSKIKPGGTLVLTSEDGVLAGLAVDDARALTLAPVRYLAGGNAAWRDAGLSADQGRSAHGRRAGRCLAQALRASRRRASRRWRIISRGKPICCRASRATAAPGSPDSITLDRHVGDVARARRPDARALLARYARRRGAAGAADAAGR